MFVNRPEWHQIKSNQIAVNVTSSLNLTHSSDFQERILYMNERATFSTFCVNIPLLMSHPAYNLRAFQELAVWCVWCRQLLLCKQRRDLESVGDPRAVSRDISTSIAWRFHQTILQLTLTSHTHATMWQFRTSAQSLWQSLPLETFSGNFWLSSS